MTAPADPREAGGEAVVEVVDDGIGLRPGEEEAVFERFYRGEEGEAGGGSGIGLTIARVLVRAHGGDLRASSEGTGQGARFTATLPLAGPAEGRPGG